MSERGTTVREWLQETPTGWLECAEACPENGLDQEADSLCEAITLACAWNRSMAGITHTEAFAAWEGLYKAAYAEEEVLPPFPDTGAGLVD